MIGLLWLHDARLKALALSRSPAWLWSDDATRVLWANPTGAAMFGAPTPAALSILAFDNEQTPAAQVARMAATLRTDGAVRLERLRGFGASMGRLLTCSCSRVALPDGSPAMLVAALEADGPDLSLQQRVSRLLAACVEPVAVFGDDGLLIGATPSARRLTGDRTSLVSLGAGALAAAASDSGHAAGYCDAGLIAIARFRDQAAWVIAFGDTQARRAVPAPVTSQALPSEQPDLFSELLPAAVPAPDDRRHPLRFVWQMDREGRFTIDSTEFIAIAGPRTAALFGQPWPFIASAMTLDPDDQVARAVAIRGTWSGVSVLWPVDGSDERLGVELSGLPVFDRERAYRGYRGFGVCRDVARLNAIAQVRRAAAAAAPGAADMSPAAPSPDADASGLSPVERNAFYELARQLTRRINEADAQARRAANANTAAGPQDPNSAAIDRLCGAESATVDNTRLFVDRLPVGVLIYRLGDLLYANKAFLNWAGNNDLDALAEAGGLDSLMIESGDIAIEDDGRRSFPITSLHDESAVAEARLLQVPWEGEPAFALLTMPPSDPKASFDRLRTEIDELAAARRDDERASSAKSDVLAKINHELRTPLNAIIDLSEVMTEERFGPIGNERYRQCLRDIQASGGHLVALFEDLLDLSEIEAGKLDLTFDRVPLNELTQQCVAIIAPRANRARVIIRTSLSPKLPLATADARSVRRIVLNLLSNAIRLTAAGGQVIVSTGIGDAGEAVLRVRNTGIGMRETATGLGLTLTRALAEANHATFQFRSARDDGTLVEIAFQRAQLLAAQ